MPSNRYIVQFGVVCFMGVLLSGVIDTTFYTILVLLTSNCILYLSSAVFTVVIIGWRVR